MFVYCRTTKGSYEKNEDAYMCNIELYSRENIKKVGLDESKDFFCADSRDITMATFCVFDGLGGHRDGAVASEFLANYLLEHGEGELDATILAANEDMIANDSIGLTTVSAVRIDFQKKRAVLLNIGDSRLYHFQLQKSPIQLIGDDSSCEILMNAYNISELEAYLHPRYVITNVVGNRFCRPRMKEIGFRKGDAFVLITDGAYLRLENIFSREYTFSSTIKLINDMEMELTQKEASDNATILIVSV